MQFQFTTTYTRDHAYLEDFQPHRRIFGVIGIMDCQAWKDKSLGEGYRHFVDTLHKVGSSQCECRKVILIIFMLVSYSDRNKMFCI